MKILVINAGSSSLKFQVINMENEIVLARGNCEKIGQEESFFTYKSRGKSPVEETLTLHNHTDAFHKVKDALLDEEYGVFKKLKEVSAVAHRIVQGGFKFNKSVLITDEVIENIKELIPLAPLHNSAHVDAIVACKEVFGDGVPEVAVFDTAFHSTMPPKAYMYPIPYDIYKKYNIRRYGFHGTSHRFVSARCAELMNIPSQELKIITCHLGNGSSITAVKDGVSVDTSMGFTPLDGFMMGTRSGSLDPSIVTFLQRAEGLSPDEVDTILNKKSGLLGVSGVSSDDRDVTRAELMGNTRAALAHDILVYQIKKQIGAYVAAMNGLDALVFTGGLGENHVSHRQRICHGLSYLGIGIDRIRNEEMVGGKEGEITAAGGQVRVFVIPTNEELVIARDARDILEKMSILTSYLD